MLTADEIRRAGRHARFRLRREGCNTAYQGARFVDGVTTNPVQGRHALRLRAAFGSEITIEPYEAAPVKVEVAVIEETPVETPVETPAVEETAKAVEEAETVEEATEEPPKRKRGRPRKILDDDT